VPGDQPVWQLGILLHTSHRPSLPGKPCSQHWQGPGQRVSWKGAGGGEAILEEVVRPEFITCWDCLADYCLGT